MSTFFIVIFEILVRLLLVGLCLFGAYILFKGMKNPHAIWGTIISIAGIAVAFNIFIPSSYLPKNRITFQHHLTPKQADESRNISFSKKESDEAVSQSKSLKASKTSAKRSAAHSKSVSTSKRNESIVSSLSGKKVTVGGIKYEKVSMTDLTDIPEDYDGSNIQTRGQILLIQRDPDNSTMYFVAMAPTDKSTSSEYADGHGIVAQIDVDTLKDNDLSEGDDITIDGGALENQVKMGHKTVKMSVIVDHVTKN